MITELSNRLVPHPRRVLTFCALLTVVAGGLMARLQMNMQMMDMLPQNEPEVTAYRHALTNFGGIDAMFVVVEGTEPAIIDYIEDVRHELADIPDVGRVIYKTETEFLKRHGLLLLKKRDLESLADLLTASSLKEFVAGLNNNFEREYIAGDDSSKISKDRRKLLAALNSIEDLMHVLGKPPAAPEPLLTLSDEFLAGPRYMISPDRTMGLMLVRTPLSIMQIDRIIPLVNDLERVVKRNQQPHNVTAGITGFTVLQRDEMAATQSDMSKSSVLSLVLVLAIFLAGFRLLRYAVLAVIPLIVGIIWAMGVTELLIGSLNVFTAMMGAILIGLGIDYAIHITALYTEERRRGTAPEEAIQRMFAKAARGIVTGSVTTAIGFGTFGLSSFPAFSEFGLTLAVGILCTLVASILILPALLLVFGRKPMKPAATGSRWTGPYEAVILRRPWLVVLLAAALVSASITKFGNVPFTTDLKKIEPKGLESLALNDKMIEKFDFCNDPALAVCHTLEEAHQLKEDAEELETISMVESIASYVPTQEQQTRRLALVRDLQQGLAAGPDPNLHLDALAAELQRLEDNLVELSDLSYMSAEHKIVNRCDELTTNAVIADAAQALPGNEQALHRMQQVFMSNHLHNVRHANSSTTVTLADLPENTRAMYLGKDGTFLTMLYPEDDTWRDDFQPLYLREIASLGTPLTGTFVLTTKVFQIAGSEGKRILLLVVAVIFVVLLIDFRSIKYAVLAMIPMVLTLTLLLGVMGWCGMAFDFVNIIALPIVIGIGVDDGVHLIHRYRIERKLLPTVQSTGRGILLTTLTTMAAFGTMIISSYQGFASFGLLLVIGIGWAYLLTIGLLAGLICLVDRIRE